VGFAPIAPGTFGSALGVLLFIPLLSLPYGVYLVSLIVVTGAGTWAAHRTQEATGIHDDGRIVVDEVAGQLLTLAPLLFFPELSGFALFSLLVTGFVVFRVLDIWKPGPVGWAERSLAGGVGVMADDLVAGALGALVLGGGLAGGAELGWTTALLLSPLVGGAFLA
jgi:phosphatidylglycerophosphatase A